MGRFTGTQSNALKPPASLASSGIDSSCEAHTHNRALRCPTSAIGMQTWSRTERSRQIHAGCRDTYPLWRWMYFLPAEAHALSWPRGKRYPMVDFIGASDSQSPWFRCIVRSDRKRTTGARETVFDAPNRSKWCRLSGRTDNQGLPQFLLSLFEG